MSESVIADELRYVEELKGKCPCGRCETCELALMVRTNRKILIGMTHPELSGKEQSPRPLPRAPLSGELLKDLPSEENDEHE